MEKYLYLCFNFALKCFCLKSSRFNEIILDNQFSAGKHYSINLKMFRTIKLISVWGEDRVLLVQRTTAVMCLYMENNLQGRKGIFFFLSNSRMVYRIPPSPCASQSVIVNDIFSVMLQVQIS